MIDVHSFFGRIGATTRTPAMVDAFAARLGVEGVFVSCLSGASVPGQCDDRDEIDVNVAVLRTCEEYPRLRPVYWVRPGRRDSVIRAFAGALATRPFVGAVFAPVLNDFFADSARLDPYIEVLTARNLPAFFCTGRDDRATPERIYTLMRRHVGARVVLYDALSDVHRDDTMRVAVRCAQRGDVRVWADTAGADATTILNAITRLGAEQVVFGSGAGAWTDGQSEASVIASLTEWTHKLGPAATRRVTHENALEIVNRTSATAKPPVAVAAANRPRR